MDVELSDIRNRWQLACVKLAALVIPDPSKQVVQTATKGPSQIREDLMAVMGWQSPWYRAMLRGLRLFGLHMLPSKDCFGDHAPLPMLLAVMWVYSAMYRNAPTSTTPPHARQDANKLLSTAWITHLRSWIDGLQTADIIHPDLLNPIAGGLSGAWAFHWDQIAKISSTAHLGSPEAIPSFDTISRDVLIALGLQPPNRDSTRHFRTIVPPSRLVPGEGHISLDVVQVLRGHYPGLSARNLTRSLADVDYASLGDIVSPRTRHRRVITTCQRLHRLVRRPFNRASMSNTCVSADCLEAKEWQIEARLVSKPLGPPCASSPASFLLTPARSNAEKLAILQARLTDPQEQSCQSCGVVHVDSVFHYLWDCTSTSAARATLQADLASAEFKHCISAGLAGSTSLMHAMVLGETDRIFSKPPLDAALPERLPRVCWRAACPEQSLQASTVQRLHRASAR